MDGRFECISRLEKAGALDSLVGEEAEYRFTGHVPQDVWRPLTDILPGMFEVSYSDDERSKSFSLTKEGHDRLLAIHRAYKAGADITYNSDTKSYSGHSGSAASSTASEPSPVDRPRKRRAPKPGDMTITNPEEAERRRQLSEERSTMAKNTERTYALSALGAAATVGSMAVLRHKKSEMDGLVDTDIVDWRVYDERIRMMKEMLEGGYGPDTSFTKPVFRAFDNVVRDCTEEERNIGGGMELAEGASCTVTDSEPLGAFVPDHTIASRYTMASNERKLAFDFEREMGGDVDAFVVEMDVMNDKTGEYLGTEFFDVGPESPYSFPETLTRMPRVHETTEHEWSGFLDRVDEIESLSNVAWGMSASAVVMLLAAARTGFLAYRSKKAMERLRSG